MSRFCHLHVHTEYSLLDGLIKIEELIDKAVELGQPAIAITDHGNMFGCVEFYKCAVKKGIKPIIGCEIYMTNGSRFERNKENGIFHLTLLAKNNEGYRNLCKIVSLAYIEGMYYKPRADFELLEKYGGGLICLTGCLSGGFASYLVNRDEERAEEFLLKLKKIFKDDLYVELQNQDLKIQKEIIPLQISVAKKNKIPMVATNDIHYLNKSDSFYQEVLMCIQTQKTIDDEDRMRFETKEFYLKSYEEMAELFPDELLENSLKIAEKCNVELEFGKYHLPVFDTPCGEDAYSYLYKLCKKGLNERYGEKASLYEGRLQNELHTIKNMGFVDYFLIVWDFINYAKKSKIPVGPGRGSAAGSIVSYVLYITDVDPIKYNLIFERFLNSERVTMPDIDVDFCYERRGEVIDYVIKKYGSDKVSQIVTFGTLGAKQAVRDAARALNYSYDEGDRIAKMIPGKAGVTINDALAENPELKEACFKDATVSRIIDTAKKIEGLPRHTSTHAAGVVITNKPVMEYVPLYKSEGTIATEYTMTAIEELGLLKMDFLGLRNLTVINDAAKMIRKTKNPGFLIENIDYNDKEVYRLFQKGDTDGVFQFESNGMRRFLRDFKPESIEDLTLAVSMYRPGPAKEIPTLLQNKNNPGNIKYACEELVDILSVTYGCIVYQEQVMEIFRRLAGYSLGKADIVRRAMSKKKMEVLNKEEELFVSGCLKNNIKEEISRNLFSKIRDFAKYAFNKSHGVCYSYVAYQTAFLKCHYKAEFMAALMTSCADSQNKIIQYVKACQGLGIRVLPPDINLSDVNFTVSEGNILFGFGAIKNVGINAAKEIIKEREENGKFKDFLNFARRMAAVDSNKRTVEALAKAGAFDNIIKRFDVLRIYNDAMDYYINERKNNVPGQMSLFGGTELTDEPEFKPGDEKMSQQDYIAILNMEKEALGIYLTFNPLEKYRKAFAESSDTTSVDIINCRSAENGIGEGKEITIAGKINSKRVIETKKKKKMGTFVLEDLYGSVNVIAFPKAFFDYSAYIYNDSLVIVKGTVLLNEDEEPKIALNKLCPLFIPKDKGKLYLKINSDKYMREIKETLKRHHGDTPVYAYFPSRNLKTLADKTMWVKWSEELKSELEELLGKENIKKM